MDISGRIRALRREMADENIDIYIVPSDDFHQSEYVGDYYKAREYMTGFTGSAGTAVFTKDRAGLWTDGRYFIQAEQELAGSGVTLYKAGEPGVDTICEFLEKALPDGGVIGFDGRTVSLGTGERYEKIAVGKGGTICYTEDLTGRIWTDRPALPKEKAWLLDIRYSGESTASKLARVRGKMKEAGAGVHLLSSLDDIAWLLNLRGNDIAYCPLVLSYLLVFEDHAELFADGDKFSDGVPASLEEEHIILKPYNEIYRTVSMLPEGTRILLDPDRVNYSLYRNIPDGAAIVAEENPEILMKCRKNDTEIRNIRSAHLKDAAACTKFMYWLKVCCMPAGEDGEDGTLMDPDTGEPLTEMSAAAKLEWFRALQDGYLEPSFAPISAFGAHGAIVHYSVSTESVAALHTGKMLLTDTGGHYMEGSTDITRTFALGRIPRWEQEDFTMTARAMPRLLNTVFLKGCSGPALALSAREVFWTGRMNFNHGTGHGVGYLRNVHEAPVNFRWKEGKRPAPALEKNMVISDEPGIYIEGSHGVRLENLLTVCEDEKNEYGQFMRFEPLTLVPVDLDAVLPELMTTEERRMLNDYHRKVCEALSPLLNKKEREWLSVYTRPV